ncbi:uncharacterized protein [Nicotiana sylvestris]|uniref:uncharacterized protein n=1 Tax=Nicotiana sylvestris TaxID=4096 RepID=UPI00388CAF9C
MPSNSGLFACIGDVSEMRPATSTESPIPKVGTNNKRKRVLKLEDPQDKKAPTRTLRKRFAHVDADLAHDSLDDEENDGEEADLVHRTRKPIEIAKLSKLETSSRGEGSLKKDSGKAPVLPEVEIVPPPSTIILERVNTETPKANENAPSKEFRAMTTCHSFSLPNYFEEAIEEAIIKFRAELSQCEAELRKVSGEEKSLRLLCDQKEKELKDFRAELAKARENETELDQQLQGEVDQVRAAFLQWKKNMDQLAADKEAITTKLTSVESQLRVLEAKGLAQARKIEEFEAELARARAEAEKTKVAADKSIAIYLRDVAAAQAELREAYDREKWSNDLAKFLVSSDDEDAVSASGDGEGEEGASEEEGFPEDKAGEGAVSEDVARGDVAPKID